MLPTFRGTPFSVAHLPTFASSMTKEWRDIEHMSSFLHDSGSSLLQVQAFVGDLVIPVFLSNEDTGYEIQNRDMHSLPWH